MSPTIAASARGSFIERLTLSHRLSRHEHVLEVPGSPCLSSSLRTWVPLPLCTDGTRIIMGLPTQLVWEVLPSCSAEAATWLANFLRQLASTSDASLEHSPDFLTRRNVLALAAATVAALSRCSSPFTNTLWPSGTTLTTPTCVAPFSR